MGRDGSGTGRLGTAKGVASLVAASALVSTLAACSTGTAPGGPVPVTVATSRTSVSSPSTTSSPTRTKAPAPTPSSTPSPKATEDTTLRPGDTGPRVAALQQRLTTLGYWNGTADGTYGHVTAQAVLALQKNAGLTRDGMAGPQTMAALEQGVLPTVGPGAPDRVEIDLAKQLLYVVRGGQVRWAINTSTGSGEVYRSSYGYDAVAVTPRGTFVVGRTYDGSETGALGTLYRPRYFNGGIAVHGAPHIPGHPASHGCARVSNAAMDLVWRENLMPVGSTVVVR